MAKAKKPKTEDPNQQKLAAFGFSGGRPAHATQSAPAAPAGAESSIAASSAANAAASEPPASPRRATPPTPNSKAPAKRKGPALQAPAPPPPPAVEPPRAVVPPAEEDYSAAAREQLARATLNEEQMAAVNAPYNKPVSILAGAGTGKTTTLIARIRRMIAEGIPPCA